MSRLLRSLEAPLARREREGLLRSLQGGASKGVDFCSNDYLSLARSEGLREAIEEEFRRASDLQAGFFNGSTGSRLLTGNLEFYEQVEERLRRFYHGDSALLFNSGYDLNLGLFASVPQSGDVVVFDELMHNSVREGLRLSRGTSRLFKHNDVEDLRKILAELRKGERTKDRNIIVSVESVYSMDGHVAPLKELCSICEEFSADLFVDEAHGVGVFGKGGRGLVSQLQLDSKVFCKVCTFGKAPGIHGAALLGPKVLCDYMINYCRPLIYSTSLPLHSVAAIAAAHDYMEKECDARQKQLMELVSLFRAELNKSKKLRTLALVSPSAVQGVIIPGNENVKRVSDELRKKGFEVLPIRSPTVAKGSERLRIILHSHNTADQIRRLVEEIESLLLILE